MHKAHLPKVEWLQGTVETNIQYWIAKWKSIQIMGHNAFNFSTDDTLCFAKFLTQQALCFLPLGLFSFYLPLMLSCLVFSRKVLRTGQVASRTCQFHHLLFSWSPSSLSAILTARVFKDIFFPLLCCILPGGPADSAYLCFSLLSLDGLSSPLLFSKEQKPKTSPNPENLEITVQTPHSSV